MAEPSFDEKTEAPSQRRREEARQRGQVSRSNDLSAAAVLVGGLLLLQLFGRNMMVHLVELMRVFLGPDRLGLNFSGEPWALMARAARTGAMILAPVMALLVLTALAVTLTQTGFVFSAHPIKPTWNKISPLAGLKRLFSARAMVRLVMSLGKVAVIALVGYVTIAQELPRMINMTQLDFLSAIKLAAELIWILGIRIGVVIVVLALADFAFNRWQHERDLRMSKQEVREELRRMEGDPLTRDRRRRVARQLASQRMNQEVARANVVVANPTHVAVALRYDRDTMAAPVVVAKGMEYMAQRIHQLAAVNGVPIVQRPALARSLYRQVEIGKAIPVELYQAVAELLAYVYQIGGEPATAAPSEQRVPSVE